MRINIQRYMGVIVACLGTAFPPAFAQNWADQNEMVIHSIKDYQKSIAEKQEKLSRAENDVRGLQNLSEEVKSWSERLSVEIATISTNDLTKLDGPHTDWIKRFRMLTRQHLPQWTNVQTKETYDKAMQAVDVYEGSLPTDTHLRAVEDGYVKRFSDEKEILKDILIKRVPNV